MGFLDAQAEYRRQPPLVYWLDLNERRGPRTVWRFVKTFMVSVPHLEIIQLDYWLRWAGNHPAPNPIGRHLLGEYRAESGWRIDGHAHTAEQFVRGLLDRALRETHPGYAAQIEIRALW